jgi:hypothetical protein
MTLDPTLPGREPEPNGYATLDNRPVPGGEVSRRPGRGLDHLVACSDWCTERKAARIRRSPRTRSTSGISRAVIRRSRRRSVDSLTGRSMAASTALPPVTHASEAPPPGLPGLLLPPAETHRHRLVVAFGCLETGRETNCVDTSFWPLCVAHLMTLDVIIARRYAPGS